MNALGAAVCRLRKKQGVSQKAFAINAGVSEVTLGEIERGQRERIYWRTINKIARALGMTYYELMHEAGEKLTGAARAVAEANADTLGDTIRRLRKERGLSQRRLADRAGITEVAVNRIETGKIKPALATLEAITRALEAQEGEQ